MVPDLVAFAVDLAVWLVPFDWSDYSGYLDCFVDLSKAVDREFLAEVVVVVASVLAFLTAFGADSDSSVASIGDAKNNANYDWH